MNKDKIIEILESSIAFRENDIAERQIDIDNHILSLRILDEKYSDMNDVVGYRPQLEELLRTAILEQTKVKIFLEASKMNLAKVKFEER